MSSSLYIHAVEGIFPDAQNCNEFWSIISDGKKTSISTLSDYWGLSSSDYNKQEDGISQDVAHLAKFITAKNQYPRQVQGAIEIGLKLRKKINSDAIGLVIACEWTDASFYQEILGKIPKGKGFSVEKQLNAIKTELGIHGPALAVDTACASSFYALELAKGMLHQGCSDVIVIGLNLCLHSFLFRGFTKLGALSQRKSLDSFSKEADGIVLGESVCGVNLSLDPSESLAQIAAIGLSSDGNEGSAFSPGFNGQLHAYERAYLQTTIKPSEIDYVEAHGTATILGDETEIKSIHHFFNPSVSDPLPIGSLKANIGHTLAASGIASLIKCVLMIKEKTLVPHIEIEERGDLARLGLKILKKNVQKKDLNIGISSFGFGGSNAHIVVTSAKEPKNKQDIKLNGQFFINQVKAFDAELLTQEAPIIKNVPMGPKMQLRIDPLQRWAIQLAQDLAPDASSRAQLSCVAINNLGGQLSIDFEKKYHLNLNYPELSIEAIASTLPSMLSGHPSILLNLQGHHMTISGDEHTFENTLSLIPYLLSQAEGEIILIVAYKDYLEKNNPYMLGMRVSQTQSLQSFKKIEFNQAQTKKDFQMMGEASGSKEFFEFVQSNQTHCQIGYLSVFKEDLSVVISEKLKSILDNSLENKKIALDYLNFLSALRVDQIRSDKVGSFLLNCQKDSEQASANLVVDESHSYFFDHPLDHIPGILSIHACEELLRWFIDSPFIIQTMSIRFTKFLEKSTPVTIQLVQRQSGSIEFEILQKTNRAGILKVDLKRIPQSSTIIGHEIKITEIEDKKFTHKHREENILVSKLDSSLKNAWALKLTNQQGPFFYSLKFPSVLYYAEVTRQFIMLLAHLVKEIPLNTKMNLIVTEINLTQWVLPPFQLALESFKLSETDDFLVADVNVSFVIENRTFGNGKIKAQVVSQDYYKQQRGDS